MTGSELPANKGYSVEYIDIDGIRIEIERKRIKNLYLRVFSSGERVKISAPLRVRDQVIIDFARSKIRWIRKQQERAKSRIITLPLNYENGEQVMINGEYLQLEVDEHGSRSGVTVYENKIVLSVKPGSGRQVKEKVFEKWLRDDLAGRAGVLVSKWEPILGVRVNQTGIRKMKTKWGTCNTERGRIWINLDLGRYDNEYLEYLVVHEMVHLLERGHNQRFYSLMDHHLPGWRVTRKKLKDKAL